MNIKINYITLLAGLSVFALSTTNIVCGVLPEKPVIGTLDSSKEIDISLLAIARDPELLSRIDQKDDFREGRYTKTLQDAMNRAKCIYPMIMDDDGATNSTVSVCAVDGRVYFWNEFTDHDVLGWIAVPELIQRRALKSRMAVWIIPKQNAFLHPVVAEKTGGPSRLRLETAIDSGATAEAVFDKLSIDAGKYGTTMTRSGNVVEFKMQQVPVDNVKQGMKSRKPTTSSSELKRGAPSHLPFWPPQDDKMDQCLMAISNDPGLLKEIDEEKVFVEGAYSNVINHVLERANKVCPLLMDSHGAKKTIVSVCAADGRVYFWNIFHYYDVLGWISINDLAYSSDEKGKMTVFISSGLVDENPESEKMRTKGNAVVQAASAADISEDLVFKYLQVDRETYKAKVLRKGSIVQIELSLDAAESDAENRASTLPEKLIRDGVSTELPFWPPENKAKRPSVNENTAE